MGIRSNGGPELIESMDLPEPELREHDVLIEVHASSVNPVDTKLRRGHRPLPLPLVMGYDVSGRIVKCGPRATKWDCGEEVFASPNLFRHGANAEYVAVDARAVARKPAHIDHATAATLPLVAQTAWAALHQRARIDPSDTVLIHAGSGGVGHIAVQLAKLHGCRVVTTASRVDSIAFCRDVLRADEVIDYKRENVVERVLQISAGDGVRVVIDTIGGDTFVQSLDCAATNGRVVTILGANTGDRGTSLLMKNLTIHYEFMAVPSWKEIDAERPGRVLAGIARLVDANLLRPHVSVRFPLEQLADAHRQVETAHTIGKVAVIVKDAAT